MSLTTRENLRRADHLHEQTTAHQIDHGCLAVSIQALGAVDIHFIDVLDSEERTPSPIANVLGRNKLAINWVVPLSQNSSPIDFEYLLDRISPHQIPQSYPHGKLAGYLILESFPWDQDRPYHFIAVLPRDHMPRDVRRGPKKDRAFTLVDTGSGGSIVVSIVQLAAHNAQVFASGGSARIIQVRHLL